VTECSNPGLELVDVIDEQGNVVATVTRQEMRARRLPHRCVYILVFNSQGKVFIHLRTPAKDLFPSRWDVTVGGVLASGESFDQAAKRELREELGVDAVIEPLFLFPYSDESTNVQGKVYRVRHDGPFRLQSEEIVRGEFVDVREFKERAATQPFCPDGLAVIEEYIRRYNSVRSP